MYVFYFICLSISQWLKPLGQRYCYHHYDYEQNHIERGECN